MKQIATTIAIASTIILVGCVAGNKSVRVTNGSSTQTAGVTADVDTETVNKTVLPDDAFFKLDSWEYLSESEYVVLLAMNRLRWDLSGEVQMKVIRGILENPNAPLQVKNAALLIGIEACQSEGNQISEAGLIEQLVHSNLPRK
jgi:hypothetical protein